jgi:formimidoylglutamate deiminase
MANDLPGNPPRHLILISGIKSSRMEDGGRSLRHELFFDHALLPSGWERDVRISVRDGTVLSVTGGASRGGAEHLSGIAIPGFPNLHSHACQRGMAGLAERRGPQSDSFWTWREEMYRFLNRLSPEDVQAIAAFAYVQMLEAGFTTVGEFQYLHHNIGGRPYDDLGEMAKAVTAAAAEARIGLTLLLSFYAHGGFGGLPPAAGQRRFINDPERFLRLVERTRAVVASLPAARVGIAPHSLRAVTPGELRNICEATPDGPIHIHAAEQAREVEESLAALGCRPVEWLLDNAEINSRWCVVHAIHTTEKERRALAASGAVAGLCPLTEASLGDGIFAAGDYLAASGRFGVGSDSNIQIDAAAELRQLEYGQRLARHVRNVMAAREGESTGRRLFASALSGGAQALQQPIGALAPGLRADIVVLDETYPDLVSRHDDQWLDAWIFVAGRLAVKTVLVGGEIVVEGRSHRMGPAIEARYKRVIANLLAA